ncbi:MAG: thymidine kinase [Frankiales bacterium]|nr:thymidine kinase [Frankiales bacterium]
MAELRFSYGVMSAGKSTLALQVEHTWTEAGRAGVLLTSHDRGGAGTVTSRLGLCRDAVEVAPSTDLWLLVQNALPEGGFVVADEAQFYTPRQIDELAHCVDERDIDVACFGLMSDFMGRLFPATARLVELADVLVPLPLPVLCWCGRPARLNARLVDGVVVREGARVLLGDTTATGGALFGPDVRYQVLCRKHWMTRETG